jgi:hypothetical protein
MTAPASMACAALSSVLKLLDVVAIFLEVGQMDSVSQRLFARIATPRSRGVAPLFKLQYYFRLIAKRTAYWQDASQNDDAMTSASASLISSCPFCASKTTAIEEVDARSWSVVCGNCGGIGPLGQGRGDAIALWNRRLSTAQNSRFGPPNVTIDAPIGKIKFKTDTRDLFERFPHFRSMKAIWGSPECREFLAGLLMDNREGTRQGFDRAASKTIFALLKEHDESFPEFVSRERAW